jgi:hypothetical protein
LVEQGRESKEAAAEILAANAQLLALRRREETKQAKGKRAKKR